MPPLDFGLVQPRQTGINTPFENLAQVLQVRNQQQAAAGLAEQRQGMAEERRAKAELARQEAQQAAQVRALFSRQDQAPTPDELASVVGPEKATEIFKGFAALQKSQWDNQQQAVDGFASILGGIESLPEPLRAGSYTGARENLIAKGLLKAEDAPEKYDAAFVKQQRTAALTALQQFEQSKPPADYTLGDSRMSGATNQPIATAAPKVPDAPKLGSLEDFIVSYATSRRLKPEQLSAGDKLKAKSIYEAAGRAPASSGDGAKFWVVRDGNQIRISDAQYRPGDLPASTREQGRRLTSGDAGRVADMDEALKLADSLDFKQGDTGIMPYLGGKAPDAVTNLTGFGLEAKKRQGVINLVKQIIGKGLEEGVLRKEDEAKYEKILPTLSDPPEVVQSKITYLTKTMKVKRSTFLDNLADAGYDTTKQVARGDGGKPTAPPPAGETPEARLKRLMGGG